MPNGPNQAPSPKADVGITPPDHITAPGEGEIEEGILEPAALAPDGTPPSTGDALGAAIPPTELPEGDEGRSIRIGRGLDRIRGVLGIDEQSLRDAGVLRGGGANSAQNLAISRRGDFASLDPSARERAVALAGAQERTDPRRKIPVVHSDSGPRSVAVRTARS